MSAHLTYIRQRAGGWTRVEMLIALYEGAIRRLVESRRQSDEHEARRQRMRTLRIVMELRAGIDQDQGDVAQRIDQLLEFVQHCLLDASTGKLDSAQQVLTTLLSGFEGIRDEANSLEHSGVIPPVVEACDYQRMA